METAEILLAQSYEEANFESGLKSRKVEEILQLDNKTSILSILVKRLNMKVEVLTNGTDDYNSMTQLYMVFITKPTFKGLTWKICVQCLCMCFVLYWCME